MKLNSNIIHLKLIILIFQRAPQDVVALGKNYERALAAQIIMLAPMAPHFASELWSRFVAAPNRIAKDSDAINWNANVFEQKWPEVDQDYELELTFKASNYLVSSIKLKRSKLDNMTEEQALFVAIIWRCFRPPGPGP